MTERKIFDRLSITKRHGESLSAVLMRPQRGKIKRLLYIAPLAGSGASQQILRFRTLTREGSALLSFEYQGHGKSTGTFSIEKSLEDAETVLLWARDYASKENLPLHVISTCYSTIPMLACFRNGRNILGLRSLSGVAGLFDLDTIIRIEGFLDRYFRDARGGIMKPADFIGRVRMGIIGLDGDLFRDAVKNYLKGLFPELNITREAFEELQYSRVDIVEAMEQISQMRPLAGVRIPGNIPGLFFYGLRDTLMGHDTPEGRVLYEARVRSIVPHATIRAVDIDHFGRGPDHEMMGHELNHFFEQHDHGPES
jgi:hypothetical protein